MADQSSAIRILVFRFSALGDVALTVPVIRSLVQQYKNVEVVLVSRPAFRDLFYGIPQIHFIPTDFNGSHKGFLGILKLFKELRINGRFDYVLDLHGVLRSWILDGLFRLTGQRVYMIRKDRQLRKRAIKGPHSEPLPHATKRYETVFQRVFPEFQMDGYTGIEPDPSVGEMVHSILCRYLVPGDKQWIGIAPMAKHILKVWPMDHMKKLIRLLTTRQDLFVFLFGGADESPFLDDLADSSPQVINITSQLTLKEEIWLISQLSFMITMDSANMHMASLLSVPTLSIWGSTHPDMGFGALNQPESHTIQVPRSELTCRPCTVYGKGTCHRGDFACMERITPEMVFERIKQLQLLQ